MNVGIYLDISNIYYSVIYKYGKDARVDYEQVLAFVKDIGHPVVLKAFGNQTRGESTKFQHMLSSLGFSLYYRTTHETVTGKGIKRRGDQDVEITVHVLNDAANLDCVILGSSDGDLLPLVEELKRRGITVIVIGSQINQILATTADSLFHITKDFLR